MPQVMKSSGADKAQKYAQLANKLQQKSVLKKRWEILYVLYSLANSGGGPQKAQSSQIDFFKPALSTFQYEPKITAKAVAMEHSPSPVVNSPADTSVVDKRII